MSGERILLVDDERAQRDALRQYLTGKGFEVEAVASGEDAALRLAEGAYSILVTDLRLPGIDGLELVRRARVLDDGLGVLLITAFASIESAVEALRVGVHDYILKPLILEEVAAKVARLLEHRRLVQDNARLRRALQAPARLSEIVTESAAMKEVMAWVRRAAATRSIVLITGETGTGKELVARAIHDLGEGAEEPFLPVNLAAVPENMVESELFGHERGAFTGAYRNREGLLRAAGSGTVFLDEIGELPLAAQAKLLRALEAREVQPLGSDHRVRFDARIVAATHRDLAQRVEQKHFREDLYYRLNVIRIEVPPLRTRSEDIPPLVRMLLRRHAARTGMQVPLVGVSSMSALCKHPWRGNVRELANVLERALILAEEGRIELDQLPADVRENAAGGMQLAVAIERFERAHIALVLRLMGGNRERAAVELGVSPATLYRRLEKLGLKGFEVRRTGDEGEDSQN